MAGQGKQVNSTALSESIEPGTVFIDTNPSCKPLEKYKMVVSYEFVLLRTSIEIAAVSVENSTENAAISIEIRSKTDEFCAKRDGAYINNDGLVTKVGARRKWGQLCSPRRTVMTSR